MREALRFGAFTFVGLILVQTGWILAIPPYHAIDEFDHAYRAAGVAHGQWVLTEDVPNGRGMAVAVPPGMVDAAAAQCDSLTYTGPGNCQAVATRDDGLVVIATSAGSYNPVYYAVIGTMARPFDGASASYAMRLASAVMCALGIAIAAFCLGLMRAGPWTRLGFFASLTPILVYTTAIAAPNSVEIVAALITWCALLAVASGQLPHSAERRLVWVAGVAAAITVVPRTTGPLWLLLIGLTLAVFVGWRRLRAVVGAHRGPVVACVLLVVLATVASAGWSLYAGLLGESADMRESPQPVALGEELEPVVWTLQIIGAFPFRGDVAPAPVYLLVLLVTVPFLVNGLRHGLRRERVAIGGAVVLTVALPVALTIATADSHGVIWQGRYLLPFVVGILLMCGLVLDRRGALGRLSLDGVVVGSSLLVLAHIWSVVFVALKEHSRTDVPTPAGIELHPIVLGALVGIGGLLLAAPQVREMRRRLTGQVEPEQVVHP